MGTLKLQQGLVPEIIRDQPIQIRVRLDYPAEQDEVAWGQFQTLLRAEMKRPKHLRGHVYLCRDGGEPGSSVRWTRRLTLAECEPADARLFVRDMNFNWHTRLLFQGIVGSFWVHDWSDIERRRWCQAVDEKATQGQEAGTPKRGRRRPRKAGPT